MSTVLVIAPHPDDETLGCGGTVLRHHAEGNETHWLIVTGITEDFGWSAEKVRNRNKEINEVSRTYGFAGTHNIALPATKLDTLPLSNLIEKIGGVIKLVAPDILYVPFAHDVHTDHQITSQAVSACLKWFRYPSIKRVLAYETLSETAFNYMADAFLPTVFIDISGYLKRKVEILKLYASELGEHPFPRSEKAIKALATMRGSHCGFEAAEAFQLLLEKV